MGVDKLKQVNVGIIGLGTVGASVLKLLVDHKGKFIDKHGFELNVTQAVVKNLSKDRDRCNNSELLIHDDLNALVQDSSIDIVVEVMGGLDHAYDCVKKALENKKPVVTANKALIATYGEELFKISIENSAPLLFEASVGGGIPIIKSLRESLASNNILTIRGIINGTSNYILTQMCENNLSYDIALKQAQDLGYAEADPSSDVDGYDAQYKLAIMSALAHGVSLSTEGIYCEGISRIDQFDIKIAKSLDYTIKHLCIAEIIDNKSLLLRVHPAFVHKNNILAQVNGVMNAINIEGDSVGNTLFYGPGAGGSATASAIVADIIDAVKLQSSNTTPVFGYVKQNTDLELVNIDDLKTSYYIRFDAEDTAGVLAKVTNVLASKDISIETFIQNCKFRNGKSVPLVLITHPAKESLISKAAKELENIAEIHSKIQLIRIEG
ncbi:MAG: homoserine dehydrogenase [Francisellaceae bacterium]|nr:homoserine dehydrogenase [Francisellaceae bacterium]